MPAFLLLYDASCAICRVLASLIAADAPSSWQFLPWQDFPDPLSGPPGMLLNPKVPLELALRAEGRWLEGEAAWLFLVEHQPRLQAFHELAVRVGVSAPISARWLRRIAHGIRRLCPACGPSRSLGAVSRS